MKLEGKVAIVTGGAGGIGRGIVLCLAEEGADVTIGDINMDNANKVAEEVRAFGRRALVVDADVTKEENAEQLVKDTLDAFGKIDILVNNVGGGHVEASVVGGNLTQQDWDRLYMGGVAELTEGDWDRGYIANLKPGVFMCKAVIPHMRAQKSGKIINISSIAGRRGITQHMPYGVMKGAVIIFTQALSRQVAKDNINVNCICPGFLYTPIWERMADIQWRKNPQMREQKGPRDVFLSFVDTVPLGREQTPEDIGRAVVFLVSEDAKNITGQSLNVDGGRVMD